jgi:hypothetical protein
MRISTRGVLLALLAAGAALGGRHLRRQAESTAESWTEKDGRFLRHTVNRRFTFATAYPERTRAERLLLEETFDRLLDSGAEGEKSSVAVVAFKAQSPDAAPLWKIKVEGGSGEPQGNLYRVTNPGCCGAQDLSTYFSLLNGRELFSADSPILQLEVPNTGVHRYAAYRDLMSADGIPDVGKEKGIIGVLQFGSDREPAARVLVTAAKDFQNENSAAKKSAFVHEGKEVEEPEFDLWSADGSNDPKKIGGFSIRIHDFMEPDFLLEIPVEGDRLVIEKARTAPGVSVRPAATSR